MICMIRQASLSTTRRFVARYHHTMISGEHFVHPVLGSLLKYTCRRTLPVASCYLRLLEDHSTEVPFPGTCDHSHS